MKQRTTLVSVVIAVLLVTVVLMPPAVGAAPAGQGLGPGEAGLAGGDAAPPDPTDPLFDPEGNKMPARPGPALAPDVPPTVDVWYGDHQVFGHIGIPQRWVNILGNAADLDGIKSLSYTLNGGAKKNLTVGEDGRRLVSEGDFNVDIAFSSLQQGLNTVLITATDNHNEKTEKTVTVEYQSGNVWPRAYAIDWSSVDQIQDVAQVVDGLWELDGDTVRTTIPGYDRLIDIGDVAWDDYEVVVPITVHATYGGNPPGVGLLMRWNGHTDDPNPGLQPKSGFYPLGSIGWYRWFTDAVGPRLQIYGNYGDILANGPSENLVLGVRYMLKMRVETKPGQGGYYRLKMWEASKPEPAGWDLDGQEALSDPQKGSVLLLAHRCDVSFGDVTVTPLSQTYTLKVNKTGDGTVTPLPGSYVYGAGDQITLTATPDPHWGFAGWGGPNGGDVVPSGDGRWRITMTGNKEVTAQFTRSEYTLTMLPPSGQGTVDPPAGSHTYGVGATAILTTTPDPDWILGEWLGANGSEVMPAGANTWALLMDGDKQVQPLFIRPLYAITFAYKGQGEVRAIPEGPYDHGDSVMLVPRPASGWAFGRWSGAHANDLVDNQDGTWSLIMNQNKELTATFVPTRAFLPFVIATR